MSNVCQQRESDPLGGMYSPCECGGLTADRFERTDGTTKFCAICKTGNVNIRLTHIDSLAKRSPLLFCLELACLFTACERRMI